MKRFVTISLLSFCAVCYISGCDTATDDHAGHDHPASGTTAEDAHAHSHAEDAVGPHGGHVLVLGNDAAHAELLHDDDAEKVSVWMTDHDGNAIDAGAELQLQLFVDGQFVDFAIPNISPGLYEIVSEPLGDALDAGDHIQGRIRAAIGQEEVVGTIDICGHDHGHADEAGHDDDAHEHGEDGHGHDADHDHVHE